MTTETLNATQRLGRFVARCAEQPLSSKVAEKAAICMLDSLGLGIAARDERTAKAMRATTARVADSTNAARIWADGARVALADAVLANGVAVHAHFQDDTDHNSWSHPGSLIAPIALGVGEARDASLTHALRAIVAGYATMEWLGAGEIVARAMIGRGFRTSPTLGTIGAAAAAAVGLKLDAAAATNAIAIATGITGSVVEPVRAGSDEWRLQNGHAARGGLSAAQLAAAGVLGAPDALEGPKGLLRAFAGLAETPDRWRTDPDADIMLAIMAKPWATLGDNMSAVAAAKLLHDAGLAETPDRWRTDPDADIMLAIMAKPWATLGDNMSAVAAAKLLHDAGVPLERVRTITVRIWPPYTEYPGTSFKGPFERTVQTQASTAFATAAMLVHGELTYDIGLERRDDPRILRLVAVTTIEPDDEGGALDAVVAVELADGTTLRRTAKESPRTLIFQDRATATDSLERRLARAGYASGTGSAIAAEVFTAIDRGAPLGVRALVDRFER